MNGRMTTRAPPPPMIGLLPQWADERPDDAGLRPGEGVLTGAAMEPADERPDDPRLRPGCPGR